MDIACVKEYRDNENIVLYDVLEDEEFIVSLSILNSLLQHPDLKIHGCENGKIKPVTPRQLGVLCESFRCDYVLERHDAPDYTELIVSNGGDVSRLRIYDDGRVYEK